MIAIHFLWLLVALAVFLVLGRFRLLTRIALSMLVLLVLSGFTMYFVFKWAGEPPEDSVPVSEEVLKKKGDISQEEWEEYKEEMKKKERGAPRKQ